jgi:protein-disulfide isomerase
MTTNRLLIALIILVGLGIALPNLISDRSGSKAPSSTTIDVAGMPVEGSPEGKVAIVEFSDYECPYCARFTSGVLPELRNQFISTGKVRHFFANFPLSNHPNAIPMAAAAMCAAKQDAYWRMHDALFENRPKTAEAIRDLGRGIGLQMQPFETCLGEDHAATERIELDQRIADGFQISGTPSFVVGTIDAQGLVTAADVIVGAQPLSVFEAAITKLLASPK